jgi:Holliday junction DNA helicase RuvB
MIEEDSLVSAESQENETIIMTSVRPKLLNEYIGQKDVKSQMALFIYQV